MSSPVLLSTPPETPVPYHPPAPLHPVPSPHPLLSTPSIYPHLSTLFTPICPHPAPYVPSLDSPDHQRPLGYPPLSTGPSIHFLQSSYGHSTILRMLLCFLGKGGLRGYSSRWWREGLALHTHSLQAALLSYPVSSQARQVQQWETRQLQNIEEATQHELTVQIE